MRVRYTNPEKQHTSIRFISPNNRLNSRAHGYSTHGQKTKSRCRTILRRRLFFLRGIFQPYTLAVGFYLIVRLMTPVIAIDLDSRGRLWTKEIKTLQTDITNVALA